MNLNVQACPGRRSFGGNCSSSYYPAAFGRDNNYLGGLNTYSDLGFRVARVPAIPEPSTLVIWSLLGTLGVTMGWCRRRLGDNRFRVFISGPAGFRRLSSSATRCATSPPVVSLQEPADPANQPAVVTAMSACARSWASFSANCPS